MIPLTNEENKSYCHICRKILKKKEKKKSTNDNDKK